MRHGWLMAMAMAKAMEKINIAAGLCNDTNEQFPYCSILQNEP